MLFPLSAFLCIVHVKRKCGISSFNYYQINFRVEARCVHKRQYMQSPILIVSQWHSRLPDITSEVFFFSLAFRCSTKSKAIRACLNFPLRYLTSDKVLFVFQARTKTLLMSSRGHAIDMFINTQVRSALSPSKAEP